MNNKRFYFGYVLGDTGLIDDEAKDGDKWVIENCCNIGELKENWIRVCDKLNELHEESNKKFDNRLDYYQIRELLNELKKENENLKQALWEAEASYYAERSEHPCDYEDWIEELKEDWDREYWND